MLRSTLASKFDKDKSKENKKVETRSNRRKI